MANTIRELTVGDEVFLVHQKSRGQSEERTAMLPVVRVGVKYAYVDLYGLETPFRRDTGESHHSESNVRSNGHGFDVYLCEADYRKRVAEIDGCVRLMKRLDCWNYRIKNLSPKAVAAIHDILDAEEVRDE